MSRAAALEAALKREFPFTGKAEEHYGCVLVDPMSKSGVRWLNPPPCAVGRWVRAAHEYTDSGRSLAVCVVPVDTTADWWWKRCRGAEIRFVRQPLVWVQDGREIKRPSALVIFGRRAAVRWLDCDELPPATPGRAQAGDDTQDVSDGPTEPDSAEAVADADAASHLHAVPEST